MFDTNMDAHWHVLSVRSMNESVQNDGTGPSSAQDESGSPEEGTVPAMNLSGRWLLADRYVNKGTAFTEIERQELGLDGLLPPVIEDLATQLDRVAFEYDSKQTDLGRHVFLRALQDRNSVLFYAFLNQNLETVLPIVYTPTVGVACQEWSRIYRRERGLFLSWPQRDRVDELLENVVGDREIDVVVVTDGERVLGLGDLGIGGMGIPVGKLALYTAGGGLDPSRTLPVFLDVGTNNEALLSDPLYLGWRHNRVVGDDYDELVDAFVGALRRRFPNVLLQWEDFAQQHANRLLARHRDQICSFNDDIQGTAAVTTAAIVAGMATSNVPITELRIVIVGAGSAGTGIANQAVRAMVASGLAHDEAVARCWLVDRDGLLHDRMEGLLPFQQPFARPWLEVSEWDDDGDGSIELLDVIDRVAPHALVGVSGQPGIFTEAVIRSQASGVERPIVLPLSNPTPRAEAIPADVLAWTEGAALVGTGSPFGPVTVHGRSIPIAQVNNVHVFPGVGLGVVATRARAVSDAMFTAAATTIGDLAAKNGDGGLLPPITESRTVAREVAFAVARTAIADGLAEPLTDAELTELIDSTVWDPVYRAVTSDQFLPRGQAPGSTT
ncbi:MAG: malate dehydrogenase (oxaloacetate-decarboxylating) [Ilumatobacter sp.]|jgi:malate dehydrogenase (oxaloacetate-decarboxylating)